MNGSGEPIVKLDASVYFDYEFEIGFIIGKAGIDIPEDEAMDHVFGLTIFNDWSARDLQLEEMKMGMGAPKSKEYANGLGPVIVTADELAPHLIPGDPTRYDLATRLNRNGELVRENNTKTIFHTFAKMIAYASRDNLFRPGELIGSGTLGGGSIIEAGPEVPFLSHGEVIEMAVEGIGVLRTSKKRTSTKTRDFTREDGIPCGCRKSLTLPNLCQPGQASTASAPGAAGTRPSALPGELPGGRRQPTEQGDHAPLEAAHGCRRTVTGVAGTAGEVDQGQPHQRSYHPLGQVVGAAALDQHGCRRRQQRVHLSVQLRVVQRFGQQGEQRTELHPVG